MRVATWIGLFPVVSLGCASPGADPGTAAPVAPAASGAAPGGGEAKGFGSRAADRSRLAPLGPEERRVAVVVLPGDAQVEVDGQPVRRRDGVVELVGKVNAERRLRVSKGTKPPEETTVTILEGGASPAVVDLDELARKAARGGAPAKGRPASFGIDD